VHQIYEICCPKCKIKLSRGKVNSFSHACRDICSLCVRACVCMHTTFDVESLCVLVCVCVYNNVHIFLLLFAPRIMGLALAVQVQKSGVRECTNNLNLLNNV